MRIQNITHKESKRAAEHSKGQIVIAVEGAEYNPRTQVAKIGLDYLVQDIGVLQEEVVHLFDHLLGSNAQAYRMSEGYGITPAIQKIGQQIKEWYSVKRDSYPDAYAILNEREYLAQSVRLYLFDSDTLQFIDPDMYVFMQMEFFNNDFWREGLPR